MGSKPGCKSCPRKSYSTSRWFPSRPRFYLAPASADILRGQDGRVVKASFFCEIAMVTRGFETRLQILPSKESPYSTSRWFQSRPRFYMAPASADILRGQDGRVVKASFFYCEIAMVTRGIETRLQILSSKEVIMVRRDGCNHVRDSIWRRHLPIFFEGRMAEWLRPASSVR